MGNRGIRLLISGEQGNKSLKVMGRGEQRQFWGTGNTENQDFDFGEQGKMAIFLGNKGIGTPLPHFPYSAVSDQSLHYFQVYYVKLDSTNVSRGLGVRKVFFEYRKEHLHLNLCNNYIG